MSHHARWACPRTPGVVTVPESKVRPQAKKKAQAKNRATMDERRAEKKAAPVDRSWVPKVFVPLFLLGVLWLIVYYIAGNQIPGISNLGDWNILIGMGLMAAGFGVATLWK
nr:MULTISPECIES: cell division protein CrgA [Cutibacterium]